MHKYQKIIVIIIIFLIGVTAISAVMLEHIIMTGNKILPGVYIGNTNLSGKDTGQVQNEIMPLFQSALERKIIIKAAEKSWSYTPSQLGAKPDVEKTVQQVWVVGRQGAFWKRWQERWRTKKYFTKVSLVFHVDTVILKKKLETIAQMIGEEPKNAGISIRADNTVEIIPGINGHKVDLPKSMSKLEKTLQSPDQTECELVEFVVYPELTEEEVKSWEITGVAASYETNFDPSKEDRSYNIKVASSALDHIIIMPQQVFSFNQIVGPRTTESGYKESIVIENNEFTPGIGGGVCQVSTTLYNAVLRANLTIVERHAHSLPISYVPPGMDATVAYNVADLRFINDQNKPILLHTEYRPGNLKVMIFGTVGEYPQVKVSSKVVQYLEPEKEIIKDSSLAPGQTIIEEKGRKGMVVEVKREIQVDGTIVSSEIISRDKYKSQKTVIRVSAEKQ